jgi:hypothetical protein
MPSPYDTVLSVLQNGVTAINNLAQQFATSFPPITGVSTTVGSTIPVAYGLVQTSSGGSYKIALLPSS